MINLRIETKSYLLAGSGEGRALIDADIVYHKSGFPFIPARRIKGLLKESLQEVIEIEGVGDQIITDLFGKEGDEVNNGLLVFQNLHLEGWDEIKSALAGAAKKCLIAFQPEIIRQYYTSEIQQTAIDEETGIFKRRSLRNYRVLNPGHKFEGIIGTSNIPEETFGLLKKAALNLRYAGTRRNRGFGKIKCCLTADNENGTNSGSVLKVSGNALQVSLKTLSPIVLALQLGDQNTVFTGKEISGARLRGLLANFYIQKEAPVNPELDDDFKKLFLSDSLRFGTLRLKCAEPIPLNIHTIKGNTETQAYNVFLLDDEITRPVKGSGTWQNGKIEKHSPATTFYFHNTRGKNRVAGKNKEDDDAGGGIFYYESIDEDQEFIGLVAGENKYLQDLADIFGNSIVAGLGKSKSAQYGQVELQFADCRKAKAVQPGFIEGGAQLIAVICQSPLIILNECGLPEPTEICLKNAICQATGSTVIDVARAATAFTMIEQYNTKWRAKSGKVSAFSEGSVFLISLDINVEMIKSLKLMETDGLGEWKNQGYGQVKMVPYSEFEAQFELAGNDDNPPPGKDDSYMPDQKNLKEIFESYKKKELEVKVRTKAIEAVQKNFKLLHEKIKNHLLGRLEAMIKESTSAEQVKKWIDKVKGKPADEALIKARIKNDLLKFDSGEIIGNADFSREFETAKIYWLTFFETLRKMKKAHEMKKANEKDGDTK